MRVDHALEPGQTVSTAYDPMLGKVVAHGPDREAARRALVAALDRTAVLGLTTNAGFLRVLVASDEFRDAGIDTAWLDRHEVPAPDDGDARVLAAWTAAMLTDLGTRADGPLVADGFRLGAPPAPVRVEMDRDVLVERAPDGRTGSVEGVAVRHLSAEQHVVEVVLGEGADARHLRAVVDVEPHVLEVALAGQRHVFARPDRAVGEAAVGDGPSPPPCPGPSSTSGSPPATRSRRARCSACSRP